MTTQSGGSNQVAQRQAAAPSPWHQMASSPDYNLHALKLIANEVANGEMFRHLGPTPAKKEANLMTLFLFAQARGLHPMEAIRRYHVIEGQITMKADAMLAEFLQAGGRVKWLERSNRKVSAVFWGPGAKEDEGVTITWTMEEAKSQGIAIGRSGGLKENWKRFPRQMLTARVISEGVRLVAPDVVLGMYTPEEAFGATSLQASSVKQVEVVIPEGKPELKQEGDLADPKPTEAGEELHGLHRVVKEKLLEQGITEEEIPDALKLILERQRRINLKFLTEKQCRYVLARLNDAKNEVKRESESAGEAPQGAADGGMGEGAGAVPASPAPAQAPAGEASEDEAPSFLTPPPMDDVRRGMVEELEKALSGSIPEPGDARRILATYVGKRFTSKTDAQRWCTHHLGRFVPEWKDLSLEDVFFLTEKAVEEESRF